MVSDPRYLTFSHTELVRVPRILHARTRSTDSCTHTFYSCTNAHTNRSSASHPRPSARGRALSAEDRGTSFSGGGPPGALVGTGRGPLVTGEGHPQVRRGGPSPSVILKRRMPRVSSDAARDLVTAHVARFLAECPDEAVVNQTLRAISDANKGAISQKLWEVAMKELAPEEAQAPPRTTASSAPAQRAQRALSTS